MDVFVALSDPVRRDLVTRLAAGTARVVDLASEHSISRPAISRHLRVLSEAGLVAADDVGRERHYRLERGGLAPMHDYLSELAPVGAAAHRFAESDLDGLDLEVRRTVRERVAAEAGADRALTDRTTTDRAATATTEETA